MNQKLSIGIFFVYPRIFSKFKFREVLYKHMYKKNIFHLVSSCLL
uniref:Cytochrome b6/f complex subunit VI n=2 Tax=Debregeasia TaxID=210329 RepID=A0A8K1F4K6_9ROSA|nr:cytochrome b6/f complex subunit VI [Debregeasia orientalis]YP_010378770.1 cytochrome b6/f complex subunit VI [Debregeasia hekouensis]QBE86199.1 cytochrome b6/f complex subunit VI [Debregeasia orientalis]QZF76236.1 cytochrome b6/f complex subunit VI [Debregeasia hekouensis]QZF76319.1 cytochrome b6/f complex subunit VI [Debregeasia hekouensis]QZF76402.1 cytochrome b6/f complex subunit VI [Debregeasia hekouensis]